MTRYAVNCSILLTDLALADRARVAADAGFAAVEFWWPWARPVPTDAQLEQFVRSIENAGVALVGLNLAAGDMAAGDRGLVSWPGRESELRDNVDAVVEIAERTGCRTFNALYGNRVDGADARAQDELATENLAHAAAAVDTIGGRLVIEPLHGADRYPLRTAADALAVVDRVRTASGATNLALLADFYHLAANGDDVGAVIEAHAPEFGHVQIADDPGRGAPGTGTRPLAEWITRTESLGYQGWVALEYRSAEPDPFAWLPRADRREGDPS